MTDETAKDGLRARLARQGEDALGRLAQELLESPLLTSALSRAFEAREKAAQAQELAMGALNLPSAGDIERLTRRVRSVAHRLEGIEDALDRLEQQVEAAGAPALAQRLETIEAQLAALVAKVTELADATAAGGAQPAGVGAVADRAARAAARRAARRANRRTAPPAD